MRRFRNLGLSFVAAALVATSFGPAMAQAERLGFDTPTEINGIELVCTGVGSEVRADPAWDAYALKIEVAGPEGQFLGNIEIAVEHDSASVVELVCGGPWILAQLEPGAYTVTATFEGTSKSGAANVAPSGQTRLVLQIPAAAGTVSTERSASP